MKNVTIRQAKANLYQLIEKACEGEEIIIWRGTQPVVRLVPVSDSKGQRRPGALRGRPRVGPEFFEPLPADQAP